MVRTLRFFLNIGVGHSDLFLATPAKPCLARKWCAAAVLVLHCGSDENVDRTLREGASRRALELALRMEAKVYLSQPVMRLAMARTWRGSFVPATLGFEEGGGVLSARRRERRAGRERLGGDSLAPLSARRPGRLGLG